MNNTSLYTADRATHLKIVVVALMAATLVAGVSIAAHKADLGTEVLTAAQPSGPPLKAGGPVILTTRDTAIIR